MSGGRKTPAASTGVNFAALAARRPREMKLVLPPDEGGEKLTKALQNATQEADVARLAANITGDPDAKAKAAEYAKIQEAAEAELEAASTVLVVRALPKNELQTLRLEHAPTEEQAAEAAKEHPDAKLLVNSDTFDPALIAASLVATPRLTPDEVTQLAETWSEADWQQLLSAALQVNGESQIRLLGN